MLLSTGTRHMPVKLPLIILKRPRRQTSFVAVNFQSPGFSKKKANPSQNLPDNPQTGNLNML
jgi:hypothetical protein